jgi:hypothetical protein
LIRRARPATIARMNRKPLMGALLVAAATLLATGAYAQNNNASPQGKANAADKAAGAGDKAADKAADKKAEKADDKAEKKADKADDKGKSAEGGDRAAKKAKEHEALKEKLKGKLKGPMDESVKQELRRHAERLAKLERIKAVAMTEKDTANADKAGTLITKENARHDKWMDKHVAGGVATPTTTGTDPNAAKEGAK